MQMDDYLPPPDARDDLFEAPGSLHDEPVLCEVAEVCSKSCISLQ
jgi:hypothetical protein